MVAGLVGMLAGALVAAASPGVLTLGAGLVLVAISKIAFDATTHRPPPTPAPARRMRQDSTAAVA